MPLEIRTGSAAHPARTETCVVAHPVSVMGVWGGGTSQEISKRWPAPVEHFRPYTRWRKKELKLGMNLWNCEGVEGFGEQVFYIVSMVCIEQRLELEALKKCLDQVAESTMSIRMNADYKIVRPVSIHIPMLTKKATGVIRNCLKAHDVVLYEREA